MLAKILKRGFLQNVILLGSGTAIGQLLAFLVMPLVTRLYTPEDLGILQVFLLVIMLTMPFSHLGYHAAIPLQRSKSRVINLIALSGVLILSFGVLASIVLYWYGSWIFERFNTPVIGDYWLLLVIAIMAGAVYEVLASLAVKEYRFGEIARTRITQSIAYSLGRIGFGMLAMGAIGLIISVVGGQFAGIYRFLKLMIAEYHQTFSSIRVRLVLGLAIRYRKFAIFNTPSSIFGIFSHWFPTAYVAWQFGPQTTGYVSLAFFILVAPMSLVGVAIEKSFYAEVCQLGKQRADEINRLIMRIIKYMLLLMVLPVLMVMIWGDVLFSIVFGEQWMVSGEYASVICVMVVFYLCTIPLSTGLVNFMEKQEFQLYFDILGLSLILALAWFANHVSASVQQFLLWYAVISSVMYLLQFLVIHSHYKISFVRRD